jgi:hypothetical protein
MAQALIQLRYPADTSSDLNTDFIGTMTQFQASIGLQIPIAQKNGGRRVQMTRRPGGMESEP